MLSYGLDTALREVTLALFTALAPASVLAYVLLALTLLCGKVRAFGAVGGQASAAGLLLSRLLALPMVLTMVGLVASATHLGNPANALYVLHRVGASPLSNEVALAIVYLALAAAYFLYTFARRPCARLQRIWLALNCVAALVFIVGIAFAYDVPTIVTWSTPWTPLSIFANALFGAPLISCLVLHIAALTRTGASSSEAILAGGHGHRLVYRVSSAISILGALATTLVALLFWVSDAGLSNNIASVRQLVPFYPFLIAGFLICALVAEALLALSPKQRPRRGLFFLAIAALVGLLAIFGLRFAFYMFHLTAGLAI